jgi:hypothetical protein
VYQVRGTTLIEADKIYTFIAVRNGSENKIYINGKLEAEVTHDPVDISNTNGVRIGTDWSSAKAASADHYAVSLFNTALSDSQIEKISVNPNNIPYELSDNLIVSWGSGKTDSYWYDKSGNYPAQVYAAVVFINNQPLSATKGFFSDKVGIGNMRPTTALDVSGSVRFYDQTPTTGSTTLTIKAGIGQGSAPLLEWQNNSGTILGVIDSNGQIGIGTSSPSSELEVDGEIKADSLDVEGEVKFGNSSTACTATNEGLIRYDSENKIFQGCNGTDWLEISVNIPE